MVIYDSDQLDTRVAQQFKKDWIIYDESEIINFPRHLWQLEVDIHLILIHFSKNRTTPQKFIKNKQDSYGMRVIKSKSKGNN